MPRRFLPSVVLILTVLLCGSAAGWLLLATRLEPPRAVPIQTIPVVEVALAERRDAIEELTGYGSVRADRTSPLKAEVSAIVVERVGDVRVGDQVDAGQPLIRLDDRQFQHELDRARADVAAAEARLAQLSTRESNIRSLLEIARREESLTRDEVNRQRNLMESGQGIKKELDDSVLRWEAARRTVQASENELAMIEPSRSEYDAMARAGRAAEALAALNIERCTIAAPFDGAVLELAVEQGERVNVGSPLITVMDAGRVEVAIRLPMSARPRVRVGAPATLQLESTPGVEWVGAIVRVDAQADVASRTFAVFIEVENDDPSRPLMPGAFVRGLIEGTPLPEALVIPRSAIRGDGVLVAVDGVVERRSVVVERYLVDEAVVTGELNPGDAVVLTGLDWLNEGRAVRIAGSTEAGAPGTPDMPDAAGQTP